MQGNPQLYVPFVFFFCPAPRILSRALNLSFSAPAYPVQFAQIERLNMIGDCITLCHLINHGISVLCRKKKKKKEIGLSPTI